MPYQNRERQKHTCSGYGYWINNMLIDLFTIKKNSFSLTVGAFGFHGNSS